MNKTDKELIAPCGMYCGVCSSFLARKNDVKSKGVRAPYCAGCRASARKCAWLKKRCKPLLENKIKYCFECPSYPCVKLSHIDKRYRTLFHMSFIQNLDYVKNNGEEKFLKKIVKEWKCPKCGGAICCHNGVCYSCGIEKFKKKKKLYRWE